LYEITGKQVKDVFVAPCQQNIPNANPGGMIANHAGRQKNQKPVITIKNNILLFNVFWC
jgi:hypothetical protein